MELEKAFSRIEEIHGLVIRGEVFRGYRAMPVACTGLLAVCAMLIAERFLTNLSGQGCVVYWSTVALFGLGLCTADLILTNLHRGSLVLRRQTLAVLGQFAPCLLAGAILAVAFCRSEQAGVGLLPGLFGICFGLGILASRPFLPRSIGWVGVWYLISGSVPILFLDLGRFSHVAMAVIFGIGQILAAAVIARDGVRQQCDLRIGGR
ncbi:MAG: hypothetical protein V2A76_04930 [Planctomycetota bacterium]